MNRILPDRKRGRWRRGLGILAAFLGLNWIVIGATTFIPPHELTRTAMAVLEQRVRLAVGRQLEIPDDLNDLPRIPGRGADTSDAWGRPILLERTGDEVMLASFGKDGRPGGVGEDRDVIHRFKLGE